MTTFEVRDPVWRGKMVTIDPQTVWVLSYALGGVSQDDLIRRIETWHYHDHEGYGYCRLLTERGSICGNPGGKSFAGVVVCHRHEDTLENCLVEFLQNAYPRVLERAVEAILSQVEEDPRIARTALDDLINERIAERLTQKWGAA